MPQYEVSVLRTSHQWATHILTAASDAEAEARALAADLDFKEKSADYSVEEVSVIETKWYAKSTGLQAVVIDERTGDNIAVVYDPANADTLARAPALRAVLELLAAGNTEYDEARRLAIEALQ